MDYTHTGEPPSIDKVAEVIRFIYAERDKNAVVTVSVYRKDDLYMAHELIDSYQMPVCVVRKFGDNNEES